MIYFQFLIDNYGNDIFGCVKFGTFLFDFWGWVSVKVCVMFLFCSFIYFFYWPNNSHKNFSFVLYKVTHNITKSSYLFCYSTLVKLLILKKFMHMIRILQQRTF